MIHRDAAAAASEQPRGKGCLCHRSSHRLLTLELAPGRLEMHLVGRLPEKHKSHGLDPACRLLEMTVTTACKAKLRGLRHRVAVGTGADGGKRDASRTLLFSQSERSAIARSELLGLTVTARLEKRDLRRESRISPADFPRR